MSSTPLLRPLQPFAARAELEPFRLSAGASWQANNLSLQFRLQGPLHQLRIPQAAAEPARRDGLWQSTCFEAFVGLPGQASYWEINLCPSGHWNLYALSGYRQNLRPEPALEALPFRLQLEPQGEGQALLLLNLHLQVRAAGSTLNWQQAPGMEPEQPTGTTQPELELSATAVLDHHRCGCSYWAWRHCAADADFHRRESFLPL